MRRFVAVQMRLDIRDYYSPEAFETRLQRLMMALEEERASGSGIGRYSPQTLVVFPEDVGIGLLFSAPGLVTPEVDSIETALKRAVQRHLVPIGWRKLRYRLDWARAFGMWRAARVKEIYERSFSALARRYGVYVVAGSTLLPDLDSRGKIRGSEIYNVSYCFDPNGKLVGRQKKVYLVEQEGPEGFNLSSGRVEDLRILDTDVGKVGVAVCLDGFKEDVVSRLSALGADILVQPSANPGPWSLEQQIDWKTGSWHYTWEERKFDWAINPMMVGNLFDLAFEGQSAIISARQNEAIAGYRDLGAEPGFVAVGKPDGQEDVLVVVEE